jgi:hypothetical protein
VSSVTEPLAFAEGQMAGHWACVNCFDFFWIDYCPTF